MGSVSKELFCVLSLINSFERMANRTKVQKLVFITKRKFNYIVSFEFVPHFYGPYSFELKDFLDKLIDDGLLEERTKKKSGATEHLYLLTKIGKNIFKSGYK